MYNQKYILKSFISRFVMLVVLTLISPTNVWGNVTVSFVDTSYTSCGNRNDVDETNCSGLAVPLTCGGESVIYWTETVASSGAWLTRDEVCQHIIDTCSDGLCDETTNFVFKALDSTVTCTAGYYGNDNSTTCQLGCPTGSYCPGGNYNPLNLGDSKQPCPKGTYCPSTKLSSPMNCYNGMYQNNSGQSRCSTCPSGKYTTSENKPNESCLSCPSGTYSISPANKCTNCTNKPSTATYKISETGVSSNDCSWYMLKCSSNQKYNESTKACENCPTGYHSELNWGFSGFTGICHNTTATSNFLCKSDYSPLTSNLHTYSQATTCTANEYTMVIKAEYKQNGETKTEIVETTTLTYNDNPNQEIYSVYSGTQNLNSTINNLNKGLNGSNTNKYYAPTSTGQAYLEIKGTSYSLQSSYSGGSSGSWKMNVNDHNALTNLENGATINLVLKIQSNQYNVYMIPNAYISISPMVSINTTPIATKHFGDTTTGVTPDKTKVTKCEFGYLGDDNVTIKTSYGYIPNDVKPQYYECSGTSPANIHSTTPKDAMFEPTSNGRNICIGYTMTTCDAGYKCNSCSKSECSAGTYQDATGQSSCKNCAAGTYQNATGQSSCKNCTAGTYQDATGQSSCKSCDSKYNQSEPGATNSSNCYLTLTPGNCVAEQGAGQTECPAGSFCDHDGGERIYYASPNSPTTGGITGTCQAGYYCPKGSSSETEKSCSTETDGKYPYSPQSSGSIDKCYLILNDRYYVPYAKQGKKECPAGYKCDVTDGQTVAYNDTYAATECEAGTYQDQTGQTSCKPCNNGTYQDTKAQTTCKKCENNTYTLGPDSGSSNYDATKGYDACLECKQGIADFPEECKNGCVIKDNQHNACKACGLNSYMNGTQCEPCPKGTYQEEGGVANGNTYCLSCQTKEPIDVKNNLTKPIGFYTSDPDDTNVDGFDRACYIDITQVSLADEVNKNGKLLKYIVPEKTKLHVVQ